MSGASIEYYDIALYGFLAPVLVQIFFPSIEKRYAYFAFFFFEFIASICQVLGANIFGKIGDTRGRKFAMYYAMIGMAFSTLLISFLPTYAQVGIISTIGFLFLRCCQSFFLGGEYTGGIIYCLEHEEDPRKHNIASALYGSLTVVGILSASIVALLVNYYGTEYFRIAYAASFLFSLLTFKYRKNILETPEFLKIKTKKIPTANFKVDYNFVLIASMAIFFGLIYGFPTRILNSLLPLNSDITTNQIMFINSSFLVLYCMLLLVFGYQAYKFGTRTVMSNSILASIFLITPAISLINSGHLIGLLIAKLIFTILTASFIAPFHAWTQNKFRTNNRYRSVSSASASGKCFSTILLACSTLIYDNGIELSFIAFIMTLVAIMAFIMFKEKLLVAKTV